MKSRLFFVFLGLLAYTSTAQISFQPGYLVFNNGDRSDLLIRNADWRVNPSVIEYKTSPEGEVQSATIADLKEFGIQEASRFIRFTLKIDSSSDNAPNYSRVRNPEYEEQTVFLRVLVDGKVDLYQYTDSEKNRFFYSLEEAAPQQLIYKQYQVGTSRGQNNDFRNQLLNAWACETDNRKEIETLAYTRKALISFLTDYNDCLGARYKLYEAEAEVKGNFHLKIKAGGNQTSIQFERLASSMTLGSSIEMKNSGAQLGLEAEYRLPFNKNKWGVFLDPAYQQAKVETAYHYQSYSPDKTTTLEADLKLLSVPLGLRHYFFLNESSAVFANVAYELTSFLGSTISDSEGIYSKEMEVNDLAHSLQAGAGFSFKNKFSAEIKFSLPRNLLEEHSGANSRNLSKWEAKTSYVAVLLGYTIF